MISRRVRRHLCLPQPHSVSSSSLFPLNLIYKWKTPPPTHTSSHLRPWSKDLLRWRWAVMKVDLGGGLTEGKEQHGPNSPRGWEDGEGNSCDGTVDKILWKLFIAPQAVRATAQPYPLSEKLEGPSPVCLLSALDQLEGGDVIGDWASLPQLQWRRGDEGNMFYRVRYKPTWLQTSGTDIRSSENVSVTPAALRMRGF